MREELKRALSAPQSWIAFAVSFIALLGYSLAYWIGCMIIGEWVEYRESALQLSIGGIFFGGFMLLLPFCAALAYSTSQVDDLVFGMMQWETIRSSVAKYVLIRVKTCMCVSALVTSGAFILHAILWNIIAVPVDPVTYPNHAIYFAEDCVFYEVYSVWHGLPVYVEMTLGIAFTASIWSVVALAVAVWVPDKLLTVAIPSFIYYLWNADVLFYFTGIKSPHPAILFNDGLTIQKAFVAIVIYLIVFFVSLAIYYIGCRRRCINA